MLITNDKRPIEDETYGKRLKELKINTLSVINKIIDEDRKEPKIDEKDKIITWELAQNKYDVNEYFLQTLAIRCPNICSDRFKTVKDIWK